MNHGWVGFLGVALLVGSTLVPDEPNVLDAHFSPELPGEQRALLDSLARQVHRAARGSGAKSILEEIFRTHSKSFAADETDYLYFLLLATEYLHRREALSDEEACDSAELFKAWWTRRVLGVTFPKGRVAPLVRSEIEDTYLESEHLLALWDRFAYRELS